ncbi:hypothetical protein A1F96_00214 [Pyrenophora tritici-repentis]|nr:hypothetical protein PtrEW7m1_002025 [Pyrenophora tritici-repentis]PZD01957.1 hypothetical protein A1F95_02065 [Pyrenophora tritici-repentis]PZD36339.1 hypothetical protein A1F96_00214 [Pyrenophora tritici-repentis]
MTFGRLSQSEMIKMMYRQPSRFAQVLPSYRRLIFWALAPAAFAQFACKMSILLFYRRIFFISDRYRMVSLVLMIFTIIWFLIIVVVVLFICRPSLNFWDDKGTPVSQCVHWQAFAYSMLIVDMVIDVFILVLPIRTAMKLHLPRKNRIAVAGIFALGGFVVITNVIRIVFMHLHVEDGEILFNKAELWTSIHL